MGIKTIHCKFCGKEDKNYAGYCQKCYIIFVYWVIKPMALNTEKYVKLMISMINNMEW